MNISEQRAELEAELKRLNEEEAANFSERRKAVKRQWKFELLPVGEVNRYWLEIHDPSVKAYSLRGTIVNAEEMKAAGHSDDSVKGGSMVYLFNTLSGRLIKADGGGSLFIEGRHTSDKNAQLEVANDRERVWDELSLYLATYPDGGDVTSIVLSQRHFGWA